MMQVWTQWQIEVLTFLQGDFEEELWHMRLPARSSWHKLRRKS
jgi:hypothetical protein